MSCFMSTREAVFYWTRLLICQSQYCLLTLAAALQSLGLRSFNTTYDLIFSEGARDLRLHAKQIAVPLSHSPSPDDGMVVSAKCRALLWSFLEWRKVLHIAEWHAKSTPWIHLMVCLRVDSFVTSASDRLAMCTYVRPSTHVLLLNSLFLTSRVSEDTALLLLKEIYQTQGISLDQPLL